MSESSIEREIVDAYMRLLGFAKTLELACAQQLEAIGRGGPLLEPAEQAALLRTIHVRVGAAVTAIDALGFPLQDAHHALHAAFPQSVPQQHQQVTCVAKDPARDIERASTNDLRAIERAVHQQRNGPRIVRPAE